MKNIVLCLDGTANQFAKNRTNVLKVYEALERDPARQIAYYHPGLGTMEPPGALTSWSRRFWRLLGLAFGTGLMDDVRDAYVFLMHNYEPGDRIFLFGFSRGAYTARALTSLLHNYGLVDRGHEPLVPYITRLLVGVSRAASRGDESGFALAEEFMRIFGMRECKPWFVGLWDTVSSVGWIENPLRLPNTGNNPDIAHARHAIAIDERRAFFRTNLWRPKMPGGGPVDLKQVWFPGVHCDVGGGFAEDRSGLSACALEWMIVEAEQPEIGLILDPERRAHVLGDGDFYASPNPGAARNKSLYWYWWPAEFLLKRHYNWKRRKEERSMNLGRPRTIPKDAMIYASAYEQEKDYVARLPKDAVRVPRVVTAPPRRVYPFQTQRCGQSSENLPTK
jgi:uncharacterized protein (DUF2235 family)